MFAYTFGSGELLWSMLWFFMFVIWLWVLIAIFGDIFRSDDLSGVAKGFWVIFVVILPWLGILVYLIARGSGMQNARSSMHRRKPRSSRTTSARRRGPVATSTNWPSSPSSKRRASSPTPSSKRRRRSCFPERAPRGAAAARARTSPRFSTPSIDDEHLGLRPLFYGRSSVGTLARGWRSKHGEEEAQRRDDDTPRDYWRRTAQDVAQGLRRELASLQVDWCTCSSGRGNGSQGLHRLRGP